MLIVSERIALGRIGRAHGIHGAFRLWPYAGNTERFALLHEVTLSHNGRSIETEVKSSRVAGRYVIIQTGAFSTPEDIRPWLGGDLEVDASQRIDPGPGRYFQEDVIGLRVETTAGRRVGTVTDIIEAAANDVYVCHEGDHEFLIPAVDVFIKEYDIPGGRLIIEPIPGLLGDEN